MKKAIWLIQDTTAEQLSEMKERAPEFELITVQDPQEMLAVVEIIYGWKKELTELISENKLPQLRWIQASSAGVDYLDLDLFQKHNITLTNGSGIHGIPIAESVFGMLLFYTRGIKKASEDQKDAMWDQVTRLIELQGKTIMIVGTGKIGFEVGRLAKAFGMETIGVNRSGRQVEYMDTVIRQTEITVELPKTDIVVNSLPLTDETNGFYNEKLFNQMKKHTLFINVGRGASVKTNDLIQAIKSNNIAFAGLDVFEEEPLASDSPLWKMPEVLITPHISGIAEHFKKRLGAIFLENLTAYIGKESLPKNVVDYSRSY